MVPKLPLATAVVLAAFVLAIEIDATSSIHPWVPSGMRQNGLEGPAVEPNGLAGFIFRLPKAELHVHIEGTLEADMMFKMAQRNGIKLPYASLEEAKAARASYTSLQDFLNVYFIGSSVLLYERDFFQLADAYLAMAAQQNVRRAEIFFDPQSHLQRGVAFNTFFPGLLRAVQGAQERYNISASLIMCFLRDLGPEAAADVFEQAAPHLGHISGVGLDSAELGFPGSLFRETYEKAGELGLHRVAHAGEEGGPEYVWDAIKSLGVERVDHGVHSIEDPRLVKYLIQHQLPLTTCPLSNLQLQVYAGTLPEKYRQLLSSGMAITINSDDPAYFGAYITANYAYVAQLADLAPRQLADLAVASFRASFIGKEEQERYIQEVEDVLHAWELEWQHAAS